MLQVIDFYGTLFAHCLKTEGGGLNHTMGGATPTNAGLFKNNPAIKATEASNQWNYFQLKSTKQSFSELARDLAQEDKKASQSLIPASVG